MARVVSKHLITLQDLAIGTGKVIQNRGGVDVELDTMENFNDKVTRVPGKGLSSNDYTTDEKDKLNNLLPDGTKNLEDRVLVERYYHEGEQAISTVVGAQDALDNLVNIKGDAIIDGIKTFTMSPKVPKPVAGDDTANLKYLNDKLLTVPAKQASNIMYDNSANDLTAISAQSAVNELNEKKVPAVTAAYYASIVAAMSARNP